MQNVNQSGDHWIVIWINTIPESFNSLAEKLTNEFEPFLISHRPKYKYNTKRLQSDNSNVCGQYCLMNSYLKCNGYSFKDYLNLFNDDGVLTDLFNYYRSSGIISRFSRPDDRV